MTIKFSALCLRRLLETRTVKSVVWPASTMIHSPMSWRACAQLALGEFSGLAYTCRWRQLYGECLLSAALICVLDNSAVYKVLA